MLVLAVIGRGGTSAYVSFSPGVCPTILTLIQWRYVTWTLVATLEACLIIGYNPFSSFSNPLSPLLNPVTQYLPAAASISSIPSMAPYQWVFFLRQLFVSTALALGQVVPVLFPPPPTQNEIRAREAEIARLAIALDPVVRQIIVQSAISDKHGMFLLSGYLARPKSQACSARNSVQRSSIPWLSARPASVRV